MSSNNTTTTINSSTGSLIVAYYSLALIVFGTLFNIMTFVILCRSTFRNNRARARATLHYMRVMAIFDILMLYGWNLDHYLTVVYQFHILRYSIISCRFISFLSYFAAQSSAWLRVFVCFDRYLLLSRLHRTWNPSPSQFSFFLFVCYYRANGTISALSWLYDIYPLWDYVNLGVYNCAPFIFMVIFNSGVIYHLIRLNRTRVIQNSRIQHRAISITLVITTFLFLLMTVPSTIAFAFFSSSDATLLRSLDGFLYSYHILSFPLYLIAFDEFRQEFIAMIICKKNDPRVAPHVGTAAQGFNRT